MINPALDSKKIQFQQSVQRHYYDPFVFNLQDSKPKPVLYEIDEVGLFMFTLADFEP